MSSWLGIVLLCMVVARCNGASLTRSVSVPKETSSTTLRLTAQRNDTGSWSTRFGDYQMIIEHKHFDTPNEKHSEDDGTWTLKVKHTSTVFQDEAENTSQTDDADPLTATLNNILDNNDAFTDEMIIMEPVDVITNTEQPFIVGIQVNTEPPLSSNDSVSDIVEDSFPLYNASAFFMQTEDEDDEKLHVEEERRIIMERYPRSRSLVHDTMGDEYMKRGYRYYSGVGWLKLNTSHWQWFDARRACEEDGSHLAIPDTTQKISVFRQVLKDNADVLKRAVLKNQVFIGVYDPERNRKLTTVLGEPYRLMNELVWFPDEPNNAHPGEDCVTLHLEGKMRDVPCFYNLPFLCQID